MERASEKKAAKTIIDRNGVFLPLSLCRSLVQSLVWSGVFMLYTVAKENVIKNLLFRKRELLLIPFWAQNTLFSHPMDKLIVVSLSLLVALIVSVSSSPFSRMCMCEFCARVFQCGTCGNFDELLCYCYIFFNYLSKFFNLECTRRQSIFATWESVSSKSHCTMKTCETFEQNVDAEISMEGTKRGNQKKEANLKKKLKRCGKRGDVEVSFDNTQIEIQWHW